MADDRPSFANHPRFPEAKQIVCDLFPAAIEKIGIRESDYVAVITRGHRYDADCLRELLRGIMPRYLGMIGSKRRTVGLLNMLEEEGFSRADLDRIHTPIGLDIGALTVKEIAISIVAELIAERRRTTIAVPRVAFSPQRTSTCRCWKPLHAVIFPKRSCSCTRPAVPRR